MSYVDSAVQDIMDSENSYNPDYSRNIMEFVISSLHDQISALKSEIAFLRAKYNFKNSTIGQLFNELSKLRKKECTLFPSSESSVDLANLVNNPVNESTINCLNMIPNLSAIENENNITGSFHDQIPLQNPENIAYLKYFKYKC